MGTNYYFRKHIGEKCCHCGRGDEYKELHVGKSSAGWKFLFNPLHDEFKSFKDWKKTLDASPNRLFGEYGRNVSLEKFYELVESKQNGWDIKDYRKEYPSHVSGSDLDSEYYDKEGYRIAKFSDFS